MSAASLTFDMGQTGFRARVALDDRVIAEVTGPGYLSGTPLDDALITVAREAACASGVEAFENVAGGMTGVYGRVPDTAEAARCLRSQFGTTRLAIADDAVTSYLGALGQRSGVVVAAGTGLVALGRGSSGRWARVDGVGAMIGDEGAGWWIGRQGLIAAVSASDGREGGSDLLLEAAQEAFGSIGDMPAVVATAASPIAAVAGFARHVAGAARHGDPVARTIWSRAVKFIGLAITAAAHRAHVDEPVKYVLVGGISGAIDLIEPALDDYLRARLGMAARIDALGNSLDGARALLTMTSVDALGELARVSALTKDETT